MEKKWIWTLRRIVEVLNAVLLLGVIVLVWVSSFYLARTGIEALPKIKGTADLATILFGSASLALFFFSILVAIVAIVGWEAVEGKIRESVESVTSKRLEKVENEARGRSWAVLGYVIGENSVTPDFLEPLNEERLIEAIEFSEKGYALLKGTGLPAEFMVLNNLLGYACVLPDRSRRGYFLEGARRLRAAAEEHDSLNLLLTYCKVICEFSLEPREIEEAYSTFQDVRYSPRLNDKQKREADYLASLFSKKLQGRLRQR